MSVDPVEIVPVCGSRSCSRIRLGYCPRVAQVAAAEVQLADVDVGLQFPGHDVQVSQAVFGVTEEKMFPGAGSVLQGMPHEQRAVGAVGKPGPTIIEQPDDRHAIREDKVEPGQYAVERRDDRLRLQAQGNGAAGAK